MGEGSEERGERGEGDRESSSYLRIHTSFMNISNEVLLLNESL